MNDQTLGRRDFIKGAVAGGAAAATAATPHLSENAKAEQTGTMPAAEGYTFFNLAEAAFVEALVDHMVPADELSPKGTDIGINVYIDRALAGAWGKGERLYMQGPWKLGAPSQGYQLPLTPAQLCRAGIEATNAHCHKTYGKSFDLIDEQQREDVLVALSTGKLVFDNGLPARVFWSTVYQTCHGRNVLGPDLRRQPRQGGLASSWLSRRHRGQSRECRAVPRQEIHCQSGRHCRYELTGGSDGNEIEGSRCGRGRPWLDRRYSGEGACGGRAQGGRARARRHAHKRERLRRPEHPRRAALRDPPRPHAEHRARYAHHPEQSIPGSAAHAAAGLVPAGGGRGRLGRALERAHLALDRHGIPGALALRGALRQELHSRRHDHCGLGHHLRRARTLLRQVRACRGGVRQGR